jgi:DNA primase
MGGRISDDALRTIRERANLAEVVSDSVSLRRRGRSLVGLCPFHAEKTPSFTVSEERGFYHCFGCGEHGDVFSFVMKMQALAFPDAVRFVAERFGLPVPTEVSSAPRQRTEPLVAVNQVAAAFFREQLRAAAGARCRRYLEERGITQAAIDRFGLGYAPGGGDALVRALTAQGLAKDEAFTAGLIGRSTDGRLYDRFRDRLMFPISDLAGRVIAFGGRVLPGTPVSGDPPPKYLNSPESPVFKKGQTLYGLALARDAVRSADRVVVVEGYLDVIALAQAGIGEVVAPLGTALTADQLRVLRRFTETVIACFDGDEAGRRAAARSFPVFIEAGLWGRGVFLPAGDDPDTFVRSRGADVMAQEIAQAQPLVDAFVDGLAGPRLDAVGRRADAAKEISRLLRAVQNPFEREALMRVASYHLGVREALLGGHEPPAPTTPAPAAAPADRARSAEALLVELMALEPRLASMVHASGVIAEFEEPEWRTIAETIVASAQSDAPATVIERLPRELRDRVVRRLLDAESGDRERMLADCIARIRDRRRSRTQLALKETLRAAEARGDAAAARVAQEELNRFLSEKNRT